MQKEKLKKEIVKMDIQENFVIYRVKNKIHKVNKVFIKDLSIHTCEWWNYLNYFHKFYDFEFKEWIQKDTKIIGFKTI